MPVALVLQVMRGSVGGKARDHAGPKRCLAVVGEQVRFALENINEFILPRVPVMQRRSGARRQTRQIGSEIAQAEEVAEWTFVSSGRTRGERRGIVGAFAARRSLACKQGRAIGHGVPPMIVHSLGAD